MKQVTRLTHILLLIAFVCAPLTAAFGGSYKKLVVFGDSLSDHGNMNAIFNTAPVTWSNGDIWVDYLARTWSVSAANLTNKAYGGAMTSSHLTAYAYQNDGNAANDAYIPTLQALGFKEQVTAYVGASPQIDSSQTLFAIWIGSNDIDHYLTRQAAGDTTLPAAATYIQTAVTRIKDAVVQLSGSGARHFLLLNIPDIGKTPKLASQSQAIKDAATQFSRQFNLAMQAAVEGAVNTLNGTTKGHTLEQFDTFTFLEKVITEQRFPNTTGTLVVLDGNGNRTSAMNSPVSDYLFWDAIHPTTKAHEILAGEVNSQMVSGSSGCFINAAAPF